ncbi:glycosyl transferase family 2 [Palleronia aestuarii]|uniref:Glycosyl transferase family 2 n=1 Tax=Palleronia aestuarii TaxID=568105 RepID=A0A2W7NT52_9RHOB|nr:glycosyltransferase [Palleronia aestuarii]PZX16496.1 glycosyl transferase family 2 [Palleronia aestuarii]
MIPIAVIPARDEARRLPAALAALHREGVTALVVANGCCDATASVARALGVEVIETPMLSGGVGEARAIGLSSALLRNPAWVMTTDADCVLAPGTGAVLERALRDADAVFGRVEPDPGEFADLPPAVRHHGLLEDRRDVLSALIAGHVAACSWNPIPCHGQSPGALIAWRPDAYRSVGGIVPMPRNEDRRMAATLQDAGLRVARPWDAVVIASCRLRGRAPGGMAATIAERARSDLSLETVALGRECAALERRLAALVPREAWPPLPTPHEGDCDVLPFRQAAI